MEMHENPCKSKKSMKINNNLINTMEFLRGQEANLESSKGFYKVSRSLLSDVSIHVPKSMEIMKIVFLKTIKSYENL